MLHILPCVMTPRQEERRPSDNRQYVLTETGRGWIVLRMPNTQPPPFNDVVLAWLKTRRADAAQVTKVDTYGTDWAGDTEGGFYAEFDTTVIYLTTDGKRATYGVSGEDCQSLWDHVMRSWPGDP